MKSNIEQNKNNPPAGSHNGTQQKKSLSFINYHSNHAIASGIPQSCATNQALFFLSLWLKKCCSAGIIHCHWAMHKVPVAATGHLMAQHTHIWMQLWDNLKIINQSPFQHWRQNTFLCKTSHSSENHKGEIVFLPFALCWNCPQSLAPSLSPCHSTPQFLLSLFYMGGKREEAFLHKIAFLTSLPVCGAVTNGGVVGAALLLPTAKNQS